MRVPGQGVFMEKYLKMCHHNDDSKNARKVALTTNRAKQ